jgi:hypothetical protein
MACNLKSAVCISHFTRRHSPKTSVEKSFAGRLLKITFEDMLSAFVGSLVCIAAWSFIGKRVGSKKA